MCLTGRVEPLFVDKEPQDKSRRGQFCTLLALAEPRPNNASFVLFARFVVQSLRAILCQRTPKWVVGFS